VEYQHFEHPDFEIDIPAGWMKIPSSRFEAVFVMPPFPEGPGINIAITIIKVSKPTSFEEVVTDLRRVQEADYPGYQIHDEHMLEFPNQSGFAQFYTWENTEDHIAIAQTQIIVLSQTALKVGILTFTRPLNVNKEDVKILDALFYNMASSFMFRSAV
jgi:hypothetical protein